jgi:hypothetical protein
MKILYALIGILLGEAFDEIIKGNKSRETGSLSY